MKQPQSSRFSYLLPWISFVILCFAVWLRLWQVHLVPPSPYWEEAALGYDAYSILKTGKDHHGTSFPIVAFESFGDWKPSGYFYALLPSIAVFGLTVFSVRLPSVLAGVGLVWLAPLFISQILGRKLSPGWTIVTRLLTAVSPWLLLFSRGAWEVNLAFFFLIAGCVVWYLALKKIQSPVFWFYAFVAVLFYVLSLYTYHAFRVITPLWTGLLTLALIDWKVVKKSWLAILGRLCITATFAIVLMLPIMQQLGSPIITQRFHETSIFSNPEPVLLSNQLREEHGNTWWARLIYHRYYFTTIDVLSRFFDHLRLDFLFVHGDANARHRGPLYGQLLYPDAILIALGLLTLAVKRPARFWLLVGLWFTAVLPSALTTATPHALRTLPTVFIWLAFVVEGLHQLIMWWQNAIRSVLIRWIGLVTVVCVYGFFFYAWYRSYIVLTPQLYAQDWQYGYESMVRAVQTLQQTYPEAPTVISRAYGRPAMYWWFYSLTDPKQVQLADALSAKDQGEFLSFNTVKFSSLTSDFAPGAIVALSPDQWQELQGDHPTWKLEMQSSIYSPSRQPVWLVGLLQK